MDTRKHERILAIAKNRGFIWPTSEIYGGLGGFFDYGPLGALLKRNIENAWRDLFILEEELFEIETPTMMQENVFVGSGHVDNFKDPIVQCLKCDENYRADTLVSEALNVDTDGFGVKELQKAITENKIKCRKCKSGLSEVMTFNLMFETRVGPAKNKKIAYLRPETAQGMFTSFKRLYNVARKKIPFGVCQIGKSYRNEISPRQGMIRLREFTQAEAEVFYNPLDKTHPKFGNIKNHILPLYTAEYQESDSKEIIEMTAGDAVKKGVIASEIQAYYLAISEIYFEKIGIPKSAIRCRQQLPTERAHYSVETWDIEISSEDFGWVEVAAIADRTDFDLRGHATLSKEDMAVTIDNEKVIPHVLEASFGVDRPFYCLLEHSFKEEEKRTFFSFDIRIAPTKVCVFPLVSKDGLDKKAQEIYEELRKNGIMAQYDRAGSIGKRYARADEIGVPFCITVDYDTLKDNAFTVRDRDTTNQKRVKLDEFLSTIKK